MKLKKMYKRRISISVWERFAEWNNNRDWDYRWWPVIVSQWDGFHNLMHFELQWLKWRVCISFVISRKLEPFK